MAQPTPLVYDSVKVVLGLGLNESMQTFPRSSRGPIVIYYGGWELRELRSSKVGQCHMCRACKWYDNGRWMAARGHYKLLLPFPGSFSKTWQEQVAIAEAAGEGWQPAPVCVVATALLIHLAETGEDLLSGKCCRCAEATQRGMHVALSVRDGHVFVGEFEDRYSYPHAGLAVCQKVSSEQV